MIYRSFEVFLVFHVPNYLQIDGYYGSMTAVGHREIFAKYLHQIDCFRDTAQKPVQV